MAHSQPRGVCRQIARRARQGKSSGAADGIAAGVGSDRTSAVTDKGTGQNMTNNCNQTMPGNFELSDQAAEREAQLIARQWREMSRNHAQHGRPFAVTFIRTPDGTVSLFSGSPAGRVRDE